jgi:hypothetical protein
MTKRGGRADSVPPRGRRTSGAEPKTVAAAQEATADAARHGRPSGKPASGQADHLTLNRVEKRGAGPIQLFNMESVRNIAVKYGIDISDLNISLGSKTTRAVCGHTRPDGSVVLFPTGFRSEEDLARTLVHEKFHHDELAGGKPFPRTREEFDAFEDRAYAHEEQWWNDQPIRPDPRNP